jgi:hypothetical protein
VYAGTFQHQKIIPKYEKLMVALFVCTRHIPPYTTIYRHMTVYVGISRDIMLSGFQMRVQQTLNPEKNLLSCQQRRKEANPGVSRDQLVSCLNARIIVGGRLKDYTVGLHSEPKPPGTTQHYKFAAQPSIASSLHNPAL